MPVEFTHYTITGAQDWPMFKEMLSGMRILFLLLWGTIAAGGGFMWRDLSKRIASQRQEDKTAIGREFEYLWSAVDIIAPRVPGVREAVKAAKDRSDNNGR